MKYDIMKDDFMKDDIMKDDIMKDDIEAALAGDVSALWFAFFWHTTPEGNDFWFSQVEAGALSDAGRARLQAMLAEEST
jgi:hypothetical protein